MSRNSDDSQAKLLSTALNILSRSALTAKELSTRLRKRKAQTAEIENVLNYCLKSGYIDERAIAEDYVRRGKKVRLIGRFLLKCELIRKGIPESITQEIIESS